MDFVFPFLHAVPSRKIHIMYKVDDSEAEVKGH